MGLLSQVGAGVKVVLNAAQEEARGLGHGYVGTEHIAVSLLSLAETPGVLEARRQGASVDAARQQAQKAFEVREVAPRYVSNEEALASTGIDLATIRANVEGQFGAGAVPMRVGSPPFTPRVPLALAASVEHAVNEGREAAGQDDLLVAILRDAKSGGAAVLRNLCPDLDAVVRAAGQGG